MLSGKFFAIASAILAAAVNASPVEVAKRAGAIGTVYICAGSGWGGPCQNVEVDYEVCYNSPISGGINSFGPSQGITGCFVTGSPCGENTDEGTSVKYPGISDLSGYSDVNLENGIFSYSCYVVE